MEDKPPSTYAPLSTTSISSCCEWTPSFAYTCETCVFPFDNGAPTNMTLEATKGVDPDFGKDAHRLSAIRTAPFYGVRTSGYMLCTLDGITINENFQAVDDNGKAIEGLYVTGVGFVLCPHVSEHVDRQLLRPLRHLRPHDRKGSRREIRRSGKQRKATGGYQPLPHDSRHQGSPCFERALSMIFANKPASHFPRCGRT